MSITLGGFYCMYIMDAARRTANNDIVRGKKRGMLQIMHVYCRRTTVIFDCEGEKLSIWICISIRVFVFDVFFWYMLHLCTKTERYGVIFFVFWPLLHVICSYFMYLLHYRIVDIMWFASPKFDVLDHECRKMSALALCLQLTMNEKNYPIRHLLLRSTKIWLAG